MDGHKPDKSSSRQLAGLRTIRVDDTWELVANGGDARIGELADVLADGKYRMEIEAERILSDAMISHLAARGHAGSETLSYGEGLQCLGALFCRLWPRRAHFSEQLSALKQAFAALASTWPAEEADLVVLMVLEHLFQHEDMAEYFADWRHSPALRQVYAESMDLSAKWKTMKLKR